jgi:hypothetical protein
VTKAQSREDNPRCDAGRQSEAIQRAVRASPTGDGSVSWSGTFAEGSSRTVTATAKSGHTFAHYSFTMPCANVTLVAAFQ